MDVLWIKLIYLESFSMICFLFGFGSLLGYIKLCNALNLIELDIMRNLWSFEAFF